MDFIDLKTPYRRLKPIIDQAIAGVLEHGRYVMGPEVAQLEQALAKYVGVGHCIAMSSGTSALQVALMALGVGPGDEVITTPFSFFATAEVILLVGATPVFVDIEPDTYLMDPSQLQAAITEKTKVIMPVSLYGQCVDFDAINAIARQHDIAVLEDAAQSFGAQYHGKRSCQMSTVAATSFFPSKPLGCYGDGGACFTDNEALAARMRAIAHHGEIGRYNHQILGMNARFASMQAAILLAKFTHQFEDEVIARQQVASWYRQYLPKHVVQPVILPGRMSVYAQFTIEVDDREGVIDALKAQGIPTAVHYPKPLHQQAAMPTHFHQARFPIAERAARRVMSLPFHPYLQEQAVKHVCAVLAQVLEKTPEFA